MCPEVGQVVWGGACVLVDFGQRVGKGAFVVQLNVFLIHENSALGIGEADTGKDDLRRGNAGCVHGFDPEKWENFKASGERENLA